MSSPSVDSPPPPDLERQELAAVLPRSDESPRDDEPASSAEANFSETYAEARQKFLEAAEGARASFGGALESRPLAGFEGPDGEELTLDFCILRRSETAPCERLYLLTAGIHGVEGFLGSAIQIDLLKTLATKPAEELLPDGCWVILCHVVNPFGMAWYRRWNESNVDLNRNWLPDGLQDRGMPQSYEERTKEGAPVGYRNLYGILNPKRRLRCCDCFYLKAARALCCAAGCCRCCKAHGEIKQAVAGGQPEFPEGVFYSGQEQERTTRIVLDFLEEQGISKRLATTRLRRVIHNDLHTGLGPHGHDTVLVPNEPTKEAVSQLLGGAEVRVGGCCCAHHQLGGDGWSIENFGPDGENQEAGEAKGTSYVTSGSMLDGLKEQLAPKGCTWTGLNQEFGTAGNITAIKVLRAENALHQVDDKAPITERERVDCKEFFCPSSSAWREKCMARGTEVSLLLMRQAFERRPRPQPEPEPQPEAEQETDHLINRT